MAVVLACAGGLAHAAPFGGEMRAQWLPVQANAEGLLARADAIVPGLVAPPADSAVVDAGLRGQWKILAVDALLREQRYAGGGSQSTARFNELNLSDAVPGTQQAWHFAVGKKTVSWDVGYGWRPNDVVEQEPRRLLVSGTPEGRPLLALERFDADTAWTLVWVNPQHLNTAFDRRSGAEESALALRFYRRAGALDLHGFARWGEHTQASVGSALAWVASESLELHASWRFAHRVDAWGYAGPSGAGLVRANPWQIATLGATQQSLLGFTWTNEDQLSLLGEAWHDGSAPSNAVWKAWQSRVDALSAAALQAPATVRTVYAANLAWQATPWQAPNLRRDNLYLRLSWTHDAWQPALDALFTPADGGRVATASLAWQGDRWHLEGGWRRYGGPAGALMARLPARATGYALASRAF